MDPALLAEVLSLVGPALNTVSQVTQLLSQPGGPTNDQLTALRDQLKANNGVIQAS